MTLNLLQFLEVYRISFTLLRFRNIIIKHLFSRADNKHDNKRQFKDKRFGFGGKKKGGKANTKNSANDVSDYHKNGKSGGGKKMGKMGGGAKNKRFGKDRRQKMKGSKKKK